MHFPPARNSAIHGAGMLFNSYIFILAFLPVVALGYFALARFVARRWALAWLTAASLFYYGWWNPRLLSLLLLSVVGNYGVAKLLWRARDGEPNRNLPGPNRGKEPKPFTPRALLVLGISFNLVALGYFKYANFFVSSLGALMDRPWNVPGIILPIGISFFTFQQIAYLVDTFRGHTRPGSLINYCLFVTFFPQLIAGPIVHHREMMPQLEEDQGLQVDRVSKGISLFVVGLAKKVIIADTLAVSASPIFATAKAGSFLGCVDAWGGALAYTFQLYFDFSGYSDMAIGLGLLFGVRLPNNFYSPYKAVDIIDFWRRWHITLSTFLRDYLYYPLGGNRKGPARRYINLMIVMLLGGLWHGAGWTFVLWGGLHGTYLCVNHAWAWLRERKNMRPLSDAGWSRFAAQAVTFLSVVVAWVFFRAETLEGAWAMLSAMARLDVLGELSLTDKSLPLQLAFAAFIAFTLPNTEEIFFDARERRFSWRPRPIWALGLSALFVACLYQMAAPTEFLYFQF